MLLLRIKFPLDSLPVIHLLFPSIPVHSEGDQPWDFFGGNTLATSCEELTHWKRLWCWEGLGAGGEGDDRGWEGWMASPTRWTWVWVNSGSWWWTGRPGVLQFMESQRDMTERLNWTELNWTEATLHQTSPWSCESPLRKSPTPGDACEIHTFWSSALDKLNGNVMWWGVCDSLSPRWLQRIPPSLSVSAIPPLVVNEACASPPWSGPALWPLSPMEWRGNGVLALPHEALIRPDHFELPCKRLRLLTG